MNQEISKKEEKKEEKSTSESDQVRLRRTYKLMLLELSKLENRSMANMMEVLIDQERKRRNMQP